MRKVLYILGQLSDSDVDWLARSGKRVKHAKGAELIKFGPGAGIGKCRVMRLFETD